MTARDVKTELLTLSDDAWQRLRKRLEGLTDDEYFWEPVDGCMTVRRLDDGTFRADNDARPQFPAPDPAPFTTIAWRMTHITRLLSDDRNAKFLGLEPVPGAFEAPGAAGTSEAMASIDRAYTTFRSYVTAVPEGALWERMGPIAGPYASATRVGFVLHVLDELVHHGAEIALLRDFYRASGKSSSL